METLSSKKRIIYLIILTIIFFIGAPVLVLYSIGYRFDSLNVFIKTGGINVVTRESNAEILINDKKVRQTNFFQRTYFFQNIKTGSYNVEVRKAGMQPWSSKVSVFPELVTEVYPFLVQNIIPALEIPQFFLSENKDGLEVKEINKEYERLTDSFSSISYLIHKLPKEDNDIILELNSNGIVITWNGKISNTPQYFCGVLECSMRILVNYDTSSILDFNFYPGRDDVFLVLKKDGLYAVSVDSEQSPKEFLLYKGSDLKFLIDDNDKVYVQEGDKIILLSL